jgi:hypothetical protein
LGGGITPKIISVPKECLFLNAFTTKILCGRVPGYIRGGEHERKKTALFDAPGMLPGVGIR